MAKFSPPDSFDFTHPEQWPEWRQRFQRYRLATKLNLEDGAVQVSTLLYALGKEAEQVFNTLLFAVGEDNEDYDIVLGKLNGYFVPKVNVIHERARFYLRSQKRGESAEEYIRSLYELAETCQFGQAKIENIRDKLVIGILDKELSEKLQLTADLTLEKAVQTVRQSEQIKGQVSQQTKTGSGDPTFLSEVTHTCCCNCGGATSVNEVRHNARAAPSQQQRGRGRTWAGGRPQAAAGNRDGSTTDTKCYRCGRDHLNNIQCPARQAKCRNCQKIGHFAAVCRSVRVNELTTMEQQDDGYSDSQFIGEIKTNYLYVSDSNRPWTIKLNICHTPVTFKIDTGADASVISDDTYQFKHQPLLSRSSTAFDSPGGALDCQGLFTAVTKYKGKQYKFKIHVIKTARGSNLLGRDVAVAMGLVKRLEEVQSTFGTDLGLLKVKPVKIRLREDAVPYSLNAARRVSAPLLPKVKAELERMLRCNVIEEIKEPTEWCAPMVPVVKKSGEVRLCVDFQQLNTAVKRETFVLPVMDDILPKLAESRAFSLLDAASGFWQIPLERETAKLTTFITPVGRFFFNRLPFGITSAPDFSKRNVRTVQRPRGSRGVHGRHPCPWQR